MQRACVKFVDSAPGMDICVAWTGRCKTGDVRVTLGGHDVPLSSGEMADVSKWSATSRFHKLRMVTWVDAESDNVALVLHEHVHSCIHITGSHMPHHLTMITRIQPGQSHSAVFAGSVQCESVGAALDVLSRSRSDIESESVEAALDVLCRSRSTVL